MTLLLEGRERPPHGRYRLFDAYFDTIFKREASKPGSAGALLEAHRRDVEHLHEQVGLALQASAEQADSSDATFPAEELHQMALRRLMDEQGHDSEDADRLATSIVQAATSRLVLLIPKQDGVGFEVRSLQEYMAARAISSGSDESQLRRLAIAAPSAHWRNTWLLAFARAMDMREHLREPLLGLLRSVDSDPLAKRVGLAPELARELLADSIAQESPTFRQQLLDIVLKTLELPPHPIEIAGVLAELAEERPLYKSTITDALKRSIKGREDTKATTWLVLTELASYVGVVPATARMLLLQIDLDTHHLSALAVWREAGVNQPQGQDTGWAKLANFVTEDPLGYLQQAEDVQAAKDFMTTLRRRKVRALKADPRIVLPDGRSMLARGVADQPYPESPDVRDALSIAIDSIDPVSWGASAEIRSGLWRTMRRSPVAKAILHVE